LLLLLLAHDRWDVPLVMRDDIGTAPTGSPKKSERISHAKRVDSA
jgi:hypothetical protein